MPRRPGRPRREFEHLNEATAAFGGIVPFLQGLYGSGKTLEECSDACAALGRRVSINTVSRWLRAAEQAGTQEVTA